MMMNWTALTDARKHMLTLRPAGDEDNDGADGHGDDDGGGGDDDDSS